MLLSMTFKQNPPSEANVFFPRVAG
jgi:hypothetical protein